MSVKKKPWVAFILSLVVPGAGLCYLGQWLWGLLNFAIVQAAIVCLVALPLGQEVFEYFHYFVLVLLAGSAGVAHATASARLTRSAASRERREYGGGRVGTA